MHRAGKGLNDAKKYQGLLMFNSLIETSGSNKADSMMVKVFCLKVMFINMDFCISSDVFF